MLVQDVCGYEELPGAEAPPDATHKDMPESEPEDINIPGVLDALEDREVDQVERAQLQELCEMKPEDTHDNVEEKTVKVENEVGNENVVGIVEEKTEATHSVGEAKNNEQETEDTHIFVEKPKGES